MWTSVTYSVTISDTCLDKRLACKTISYLQASYGTCSYYTEMVNKQNSIWFFCDTFRFYSDCHVSEFRSQLEQLEESISHVPGLVISDIVKEEIQVAEDAHTEREGQFLDKLDSITKRQVSCPDVRYC